MTEAMWSYRCVKRGRLQLRTGWNPGQTSSRRRVAAQGDPGDHSSRAGTKIYVCCRKFGFFSPFDLLHVLSTPTIFPMMPDRVDTPILTITR